MKRVIPFLCLLTITISIFSVFFVTDGSASTSNPAEPPFADIPITHPSIAAITWAKENGIFAGKKGNFDPNGTLTRACFTLILHRLEGSPKPSPSTPTFPDVDPNGVHFDSIQWAREKGIMGGIRGNARPGYSLPRYQLVTLLYRYHVGEGRPVKITDGILDKFPDRVDLPSQNDYDAMAWAVTNGIIGGVRGNLRPNVTVNREMGATVLYRYNNMYGTIGG